MAQRPIWRGHLRLALVSCPVALYAAHHDRDNLHFHLINPETGHRVNMVSQDAQSRRPVERRDLVRGFEFKKDHYLILTEEDFESARVDSSSTLTIGKFVDRDALDPIYFDASYYVAPDGDSGLDVFAVLRDAIAKTGRMALSRVVIARREWALAILPMGRGLVAHTLFEPRDLNDPAPLFADIPDAKPADDMLALATQLIERQAGRYEPADVEDRYETRLRDLIAAKLKGEGLAPEPEEPEANNVVDLMTALKQSLAQKSTEADSKPAPKPKKAPAAGRRRKAS
jgi:DNA end-binding protein Ku